MRNFIINGLFLGMLTSLQVFGMETGHKAGDVYEMPEFLSIEELGEFDTSAGRVMRMLDEILRVSPSCLKKHQQELGRLVVLDGILQEVPASVTPHQSFSEIPVIEPLIEPQKKSPSSPARPGFVSVGQTPIGNSQLPSKQEVASFIVFTQGSGKLTPDNSQKK